MHGRTTGQDTERFSIRVRLLIWPGSGPRPNMIWPIGNRRPIYRRLGYTGGQDVLDCGARDAWFQLRNVDGTGTTGRGTLTLPSHSSPVIFEKGS